MKQLYQKYIYLVNVFNGILFIFRKTNVMLKARNCVILLTDEADKVRYGQTPRKMVLHYEFSSLFPP